MKKKVKSYAFPNGGIVKLLRIMRLTFLLIVVGLLEVSASVYSQQTKLSMNLNNVTLEDAFRRIEDSSNFVFFYNADQVHLDQRVSLNAENKSIDEILTDLLKDKAISYKVTDRRIVLYPENGANPLVSQQSLTVKGKVTDSSGQPLPGVTVIVKGTTTGTITDTDGNYALSNVPADATLVFSFVGMKTQEIPTEGRNSLDVIMSEETIGLGEVVAIGYGSLRKSDLTGAVTKANLTPYENIASNNILERIKGSVAGVNISGTNRAGQVADIVIRGQNSSAASNYPLIVVDGAIFGGSIGDISTEDIESFTVLKDASAAAVYGSRSANGVIIIETKKGGGIKGKPKFNFDVSYGISNQLKPLKLYDAKGYLQRRLDFEQYNIPDATLEENVIPFLEEELYNNYFATADHAPTITDPYGLINQLGSNFNSTFSISNSLEKVNYYISTTFNKQRGIVINDDYKHISGRINVSSDLTDWLNIGVKSFYSLKDYSGSSPDFYRSTLLSPWASLYNEDGSYKIYPQTWVGVVSPFATIASGDQDIQNYLNAILSGVVKIPWIKGLTYNITYSNSLAWKERSYFYDKNTEKGYSVNGTGTRQYDRTYNLLLDNMIKYSRTLKDKHFVDVTLLYSRENSVWESMVASARGFNNTVLGTYSLESGATQTVSTGGGETNGIGLMARGTYTYDNRYSITGTFRRDGYSAFSKNKKWGNFSSVALRWNIKQESFMKNIKTFDNLALRLSYGTNGNQSISPYSSLARIATSKYLYGGETSYTLTQYISQLPNNDLGWESTTGLNTGIDFSILKNRLRGEIDLYETKTNNLMFALSLPTASGASSILSNIGEIRNKGIEVNLHSLNIDKGDFKWYSEFSFSLNRNKVQTILGEDNNGDGREDDLINDGYFIGRSLGTIYDYKVIGMWQQEDLDNGTIMNGMRPGDYKLEDVDGNGSISLDKDRQFIGDSKENYRWSWTNTFEYKKLSLMMYFYSIWGGNNRYLSGSNTPYNESYAFNMNSNHPVYDYWTSSNTDAVFPRMEYKSNAGYVGIKYFDRSFIKLGKVSLTYDASQFAKPWGINDLKISISGDNLFTYAPHWIGLDPETDSGVTVYSVPSIRTYMFSLAFNF